MVFRIEIERVFRPGSVAVVGDRTAAGVLAIENLRAGAFAGRIHSFAGADQIDAAVDLAVVATPGEAVAGALAALGRHGCRAAIVTGDAPDLAGLARASGVRVLGPGGFGVAVPRIGLNATLSHLAPRAGNVALVSQSASLCRAVIDWAEPNGVGFSHVVGIGGSVDIGFSAVLDWLSHDTGTGAILLDLRRITHRRAFVSAARAAARLRPVVAIRAGGRLADASGVAEAAFAAALRRAGVVGVTSLEEFLAAAETLTRARPLRGEGLAIVSNARTLARLAAGAALRLGLPLAEPSEATRMALSLLMPEAQIENGLLQTDPWAPIRLSEGAALLAGAPEVSAVLVLMAPTGPRDDAGIAALIAGHHALRVPLLVCVVGESSGAVHRRRLAEAGLAEFSLPEQAVRGFGHLVALRRSRIAARELPAARVLDVAPDSASVQRIIADALQADRLDLSAAEVARALAAYGLSAPARDGVTLAMLEDALMGPAIMLCQGGQLVAVDLPPLNLPLAQALAAQAKVVDRDALAETLVRVSQLVVDFPQIASLSIGEVGATIQLQRDGDRGRLAISPYPAELAGHFDAGGERLVIRPIRPEDAQAHGEMFRRLAPEDVRFRFFTTMREISAEQMARLTQVDYTREMAFVAVREATGETVGVSRLIHEPGERGGEFAVLVEPSMKGKGLATHLMQRLFDWAAAAGVSEIFGLILADNAPMLAFVRRLGFRLRHLPDEPDVIEARR